MPKQGKLRQPIGHSGTSHCGLETAGSNKIVLVIDTSTSQSYNDVVATVYLEPEGSTRLTTRMEAPLLATAALSNDRYF